MIVQELKKSVKRNKRMIVKIINREIIIETKTKKQYKL